MTTFVAAFDAVLGLLRIVFFGAAVVAAVVCLVDWLVRTRRVSPFSGVARFARSSIDPLIAPVERRIVRAGGVPTSAPWWALVFLVVAGVVVLSVLGFLRTQILMLSVAATGGSRLLIRLLISWTFALLQIALIVRVICSWVRVSPYSRWVRWAFVLTEPILAPLRQVIPTLGMIDITPIVAYFVLRILESLIIGLV